MHNLLVIVIINLAVHTASSSSECPQIHHDCQCTLLDQEIQIECRFQDNDLTNTSLMNSTTKSGDVFINVLDLESNNLTYLPDSFFNEVASIGLLNLRDNQFIDIPVALETIGNVTFLDMERNKITLLNMTDQYLVSLKSVNFAYNKIDTLVLPETLHSLTLWNISHNFLKVVPDNLWNIATILDLSDNIIQSLSKITKSKMYVLNLANNNITELKPHTFEACKDLHELKLSGNKISELDIESFSGLDILEELHLNSNGLSSLLPGVFSELRFLFTLSLAQNDLSLIEPGTFRGLSDNFQKLILSDNKLGQLRNDTFSNLEKLHLLDLSFNEGIYDINDLVLPPHLAALNLQNCSIRDVHSCKLMKQTDLQEINLTNNNLTCSCHLSMLYGWYNDRVNHGYMSRPTSHTTWTCTTTDSDVPHIVTEDIKNCGRYQDIEHHCDDIRLVVYDFTPITINTTLITSNNLITVTWDVQGDTRQIVGFKVSYESDGSVLFDSPLLAKNLHTFVISFVSEKDHYTVCVNVLGNSTNALTSSCESVSSQSLDYLIGILAGILLLLPCMAALIFILRRDRMIKQAEYSPLDEKVVKRLPNNDHSVVVEVCQAVNVQHAVCPYHENKAFSSAEEDVGQKVHDSKNDKEKCESNRTPNNTPENDAPAVLNVSNESTNM